MCLREIYLGLVRHHNLCCIFWYWVSKFKWRIIQFPATKVLYPTFVEKALHHNVFVLNQMHSVESCCGLSHIAFVSKGEAISQRLPGSVQDLERLSMHIFVPNCCHVSWRDICGRYLVHFSKTWPDSPHLSCGKALPGRVSKALFVASFTSFF